VSAAAALVAAAALLPALYLVIRASQDGGAAWTILTSRRALETSVNTLLLGAATAGGATAIAVPLAWLTTRTDLPGRRIWAVLLGLPLAIPSYVGAFALVSALGPRGILQDWLEPVGVDRLPEIYGFFGAWLALTLFTYPYVLLPARAALLGVDRSVEEAARSLGKGPIETFLRITVAQIRPAVASGALIVALYALSDFGAVSILRFDSLSRVIYLQYTGTFDRSAAAVFALILVAIAVLIVAAEAATRGRARYHVHVGRGAPPPARLGRWKLPALAFCAFVLLVALVLPLGVIGYWLVRGIAEGETFGGFGEAARNSSMAALLAALVTVVAALPVGYLAARRPGPWASLVEKSSYSGYALPGITVALALVFLAANYATFAYQTLALLVFAYAVRFVPQAIGACRSAFLQVNPKVEEAGRGLGKPPSAVFFRITLPQLMPGLSAGAALVFLTTIKELPATLLLSPIGFDTLAVQVWSASSEAFFARAALPALILVGLSSLPMAYLSLRERKQE
jgi:iron(III) transport system permease protein